MPSLLFSLGTCLSWGGRAGAEDGARGESWAASAAASRCPIASHSATSLASPTSALRTEDKDQVRFKVQTRAVRRYQPAAPRRRERASVRPAASDSCS